MKDKTHYRKAFDSPYLSSADIVEPTVLTISHVVLELDKTKKTQDRFNTAYFKKKQIRSNEKLKPMILNETNSKVIKKMSGSSFIEDWQNLTVMIGVKHVKFGREYVEGLRVYPAITQKKTLTPTQVEMWEKAKQSYINNRSLDKVLEHVEISQENQELLKKECANMQ